MAYTTLEISQIESIMTEEEKHLYESLRIDERMYRDAKTYSSNEELAEICRKMVCDIKDRIQELLALVEQRISPKSRLLYRENFLLKDNEHYNGIAYRIVRNGYQEFYTELSDAQARLQHESKISAWKITDGDGQVYIPENVLKYVMEDKTYKCSIGTEETLVFNIGSDSPYALVLDYHDNVIDTLSYPISEVSELSIENPVEVLGIQCTILEKSL